MGECIKTQLKIVLQNDSKEKTSRVIHCLVTHEFDFFCLRTVGSLILNLIHPHFINLFFEGHWSFKYRTKYRRQKDPGNRPHWVLQWNPIMEGVSTLRKKICHKLSLQEKYGFPSFQVSSGRHRRPCLFFHKKHRPFTVVRVQHLTRDLRSVRKVAERKRIQTRKCSSLSLSISIYFCWLLLRLEITHLQHFSIFGDS